MAFLLLLLLVLPPAVEFPTDLLLAEAKSLVRAGKIIAAENAAREYLHTHAQSPDGHYLLGYILFLQSKAKESLAEYTEGAKYRPPDAQDLKVVASDYVVLSDFADADKWFTKVVDWSPDDAQAWYDLGRTKYNENRFGEAIAAFKRTLQLDPTNVKAQDNLGLSYVGLGRNDEATTAYRSAMAMQETSANKNAGPYLNLGSLLVESNRETEALPLLAKALAISPADYRIHRELGKAYLHLREFDKAAGELQEAVGQAPGNAALHFMLAQVYKKQGETDKANRELERYSALK